MSSVGSTTYLRGDDGAITPEPPEERPPHASGEVTRPGSRTNEVGGRAGAGAGRQGGWYRGARRPAGRRPFTEHPPSPAAPTKGAP